MTARSFDVRRNQQDSGSTLSACSIYGLGLAYNMPVAALAQLQAPARIDVTLLLGEMPAAPLSIDADAADYYVSPRVNDQGLASLKVRRTLDGRYFDWRYADGTRIVVSGTADAIWATWPAPATVEDTATYLLGPTLGFLLRLRGTTCLHASCVVIDGQAVALVGESGAGKSSTAAAFAKMGHAVLSDDVVALDDRGDFFMVQPAYPRVRLWEDAVAPLFGAPDALPRITPTWEKRYLDLNAPGYRFQQEPLRLAAIYFLGGRQEAPAAPRIEPLRASDGMMALVANTYSNYLIDSGRRAEEFGVLGRVVQHVPMRNAIPSTDFGRLTQFCELIAQDFRSQSQGSPS